MRRRTRPGLTWLHGDAAAVPALDADLALVTGNVAQVFLTDDDWDRALRAIRAALRPGGYLVSEARRPERRAWEEWECSTPVPGHVRNARASPWNTPLTRLKARCPAEAVISMVFMVPVAGSSLWGSGSSQDPGGCTWASRCSPHSRRSTWTP
jgi:hypothetical protein